MRGVDPPGPTPADGDRLLLLGACVRAQAQSALRGRLTRRRFPGGIIAVDFFGDADLDGEAVEVVSIRRDRGLERTVANLGRVAFGFGWEAVAPAGGLENRPALLRLLARRGLLLGSAPESIRAVRDPGRLFGWLAAEDLPHAATPGTKVVPRAGRWLLKRRRGAGGGGVRDARPGEIVPSGWHLQARLDGRPGSAVFLADGRDAVLVGVSEQIAGARALGAGGYRHAGNIVDTADLLSGPAGLLDREGSALAARVASRLAARFGLRGLAGFDFVAVRGRPHLIEVNPRWTASMELMEEAAGRSLFDAHLLAATSTSAVAAMAATGRTPDAPAGGAAARGRVLARGVLYAPEAIVAPPPAVLEAIGVRDRPREAEIILEDQPVCTLASRGATRDEAVAALAGQAAAVRALLAAPDADRARSYGQDAIVASRPGEP